MAAVKDAVLSSAVDVAREAAQEVADRAELVGEHLGAVAEGERLVAHRFASEAPGYRGWYWTVILARVPRGRVATVCEVELVPGDEAVLAPPWVPWSERLRPGDLGPGDALPYQPDDERLDPGYTATGEDADRVAIDELGLGRVRVLSPEGRAEASERWYTGAHGPTAAIAVAAEQPCSTCGFLVLLAGSMRPVFGVCANEWSPDDGRVVSMDHGCGAHSETNVADLHTDWPAPVPLEAETDLEIVLPEPKDALVEPEPEPTTEPEPEPATEVMAEPAETSDGQDPEASE
jgi:hypothetical protein